MKIPSRSLLLTRYAPVVVGLALGSPAAALGQQENRPCDRPEHHQFDFWIGDWEVTSTADGAVAGRNSVHRVMSGCALRESWEGATGGKGTSLNVYHGPSGLWHQTWISDNGTFLLLEGGIEDGSMVMRGEMPSRQGVTVLHRLTWTPLDSDQVRQVWEASRDGGGSWTVVFDGTYTRR